MKKILKLLLIILVILIVMQILFFIFKTEHKVKYNLFDCNNSFKIEETFINNTYHYKITYKKNIFTFNTPNNNYKKSKQLKKIEVYEKDE